MLSHMYMFILVNGKMYTYMYIFADLEWWLAENDMITTELDEDPRNNRRVQTTVFSGMRAKLASDLDDEDFDSDS